MQEQDGEIDLRSDPVTDTADSADRIDDDRAIEVLVNAIEDQRGLHPLSSQRGLQDGAPDAASLGDAPLVAGSPVAASPDLASPDVAHPVASSPRVESQELTIDLKDLESFPRKVRRRVDISLAEGESVECAVLAGRDGGSRWLLATTHRIIVAAPEGDLSGSLTLPYHRTTAWIDDAGGVGLRSVEFGTVRTVTFEPDAEYGAEVTHLLERVASR